MSKYETEKTNQDVTTSVGPPAYTNGDLDVEKNHPYEAGVTHGEILVDGAGESSSIGGHVRRD